MKRLDWDEFENGVSDLLAVYEAGGPQKWATFITGVYKLVYGIDPDTLKPVRRKRG